MSKRVNFIEDPGIIKQLQEREAGTPDMKDLRYKMRIPVFVYGSLKRGFSNHAYLRGAEYLGKAHTVSRAYRMQSAGAYPVVYDTRPSTNGNKIRGELFACSAGHIVGIDFLEGNPELYRREEIHVVLEDYAPTMSKGFRGREVVKAWTYISDKEIWPNLKSMATRNYPNLKDFENVEFFEW